MVAGVDFFVEEEDEQKLKGQNDEKRKKVGFADVIDPKLAVDRG